MKKLKSPCIKLCHLVNKHTHMECVGCGRSQEEIMLWTKMTDKRRDEIIKRIENEQSSI